MLRRYTANKIHDFVREKLPPLLKEKGELRDAVADIVRECIAEETENLLSKIGNKEETARLEKELSDTKKEKKRKALIQ